MGEIPPGLPQASPPVLLPAPGGARPEPGRQLLTARQVQQFLGIDRSTVYRMAAEGRLPAIKVGRQWRFAAEGIQMLLDPVALGVESGADGGSSPDARGGVDVSLAMPVIDVAAYLLGVMMLVTDMHGRPLTSVVNPCPWFERHSGDAEVMKACSAKWHAMAQDPDLSPRFRVGERGVECAHAFIRSGSSLAGMVLAGGVAPVGDTTGGLYRLTDEQRTQVLAALPRVAAALSWVPAR